MKGPTTVPTNTPHDPHHPPAAPPHISGVCSALREAVGSATELGDLLAAALTADDQQRRAVTGGLTPTPPATDSNPNIDSDDSDDGGDR